MLLPDFAIEFNEEIYTHIFEALAEKTLHFVWKFKRKVNQPSNFEPLDLTTMRCVNKEYMALFLRAGQHCPNQFSPSLHYYFPLSYIA